MLYIGSSNESYIGVGTLIYYKEEEVTDLYYSNEYGWVLETKEDRFELMDVVRVRDDGSVDELEPSCFLERDKSQQHPAYDTYYVSSFDHIYDK